MSTLPKSGQHDATCALVCKTGPGCGLTHSCAVCGPGRHGNDDLTVRLTRWRNRACTGHVSTVNAQRIRCPDPVCCPEVGDDAGIKCPSCDGPMVVTSRVNDSTTVECPNCNAKGPIHAPEE